MKFLRTFLPAVLAGICIAIGGTVYLSLDNKIAGAVLFAVGLYTICINGLNLFTGKVGYLVNNKAPYLLELCIIWLGNLAGTALSAGLLLCTKLSAGAAVDTVAKVCAGKIESSFLSLFILGIFCGMLMFIAVDGYKRVQNPLIMVFCVAVFILCGFEHCVADMFYFTLARVWSADVLLRTLVITLGNGVGAVLLPLLKKFMDRTEAA